jgi:putative ABC transport system permease protein
MAELTRTRLAGLPGVASVSIEHQSAIHPAIVRPAGDAQPLPSSMEPGLKAVDPAYFTTFGTRVRLGRSFTPNDRRTMPLVAVVNKAAADLFWPGQNPLGRQVFVSDSNSVGELLTVVGETDNAELGERHSRHWPVVYRPIQQAKIYHSAGALYLRVADHGSNALAAAQMVIRQETGAPAIPLESEEASLGWRLLPRRFNAIALDIFAGFGLLLAAMGIYGSVSYAVTQRTREIGIRIALGAQSGTVVGLVAERIALLTITGVLAGMAGAFALTRALRSFVEGTSATNPWVFAGSAALMVVVALLATMLPARRATRVDAAIALRGE